MSWEDVRIEPGAAVEAADGRLGTVDEVVVQPETGRIAYLVVRRGWTDERVLVPLEFVEAVPGRREVKLRATREDVRAHTASLAPDSLLAREYASGGELRIPIVEERLVPGTRPVDLGELRIHKLVDTTEESVRQPVTRDDLIVERVPVNQPVDGPRTTRVEGDWLVIPIMEEVLVVEKRLMLKEEIRIRKRQVVEEQEVREAVRRERVQLEDATVHGVEGLGVTDATKPITDLPLVQ